MTDEQPKVRRTRGQVNRDGWLPGPWDREADLYYWISQYTKTPAAIVRHPHFGHLCGYVGVPEGHELFGKIWDDVDILVHGGITYTAREFPGTMESDYSGWTIGFDCGHAWDFAPGAKFIGSRFSDPSDVYRTAAYCFGQVEWMAMQIAEWDKVKRGEKIECEYANAVRIG